MTIAIEREPHSLPTKPGLSLGDRWYIDKRLKGLARFALAITFLNILGHLWLGFEQSWITPFVALAAAYGTELAAETAQAHADRRRPRYLGSPGNFISFLLSAHISGLAVGMLLFAAEQLWVVAFGASLAVASKWLFRVRLPLGDGHTSRHFLNPSNFGISVVLLLFPSVGIAPPYMFAENISGALDWVLPLVVILTGSLLNTKLTGRMPLIGAWVICFAAQAAIRSAANGTPLEAGLVPMTGFAFILFTFYMITDPATTPGKPRNQIIFAMAVAAVYGILMQLHVVFGLFFALTIVTATRGILLMLSAGKVGMHPSTSVLDGRVDGKWSHAGDGAPQAARLASNP
ncbi:enediyne biosynthesis protein UnbU [Rhizobium sophoriradicis]|uniref:RnfABCDGE type electron transport complex subunit D n=1 Tax=Rhizobium sophoriradicis TaxID=1535245 RepID=UPI0009C9CA89|nr:RnfABCDGE type electron transport complex subunit D [Rhizobium sophoriradicis]RSB86880.1 enediyne biosynthesis protein UnbU [Rhizobium sophoriradicis]